MDKKEPLPIKIGLYVFWLCATVFVSSVFAHDIPSTSYQGLYDSCLNRYEVFNNGVIDLCSGEVTEKAEEEIELLYRKVLSYLQKMTPDQADQLVIAQRAWEKYRHFHCLIMGWNVGSPMYSLCPMELAIGRVSQLAELSSSLCWSCATDND